MAGTAGAGLAALLTDLKLRSGLSYEQLARKTYLSRSTVHRYCTGRGCPAMFAPVEAIASACGADRTELAKAHRLWERAERAHLPTPVVEPPPSPPPRTPVRSSTRPRGSLALLVALVVVLLAGDELAVPRQAPPSPAGVPIAAPMWTRAPNPVAPEFVGVTINNDTGVMPSFAVGSARLWDSATRWHDLEPARGHYRWDTLDRLLRGAATAKLPMVFTFGGTPAWSNPQSAPSPYPDGSRTGPPGDLRDWARFVRTLAARYRGRIGAYELWDMANHRAFFTGSPADMVAMTATASHAVRSVDPAATVVCPSMGELWSPAALDWMTEFAELGGYRYCDAAAVKLSPRTAADPPEQMVPLARRISAVLQQARTGIDMWSTGTAYDVPSQRPLDPDRGAQHAVRFFLAGLYAQYQRMYFYSWGSTNVPIVLQVPDGPRSKAARWVERLHQWLAGSQIFSCGHGTEAGLPDQLWQCRLTRGGETLVIWWTVDRSVHVPAPPRSTAVEQLDGTSRPVGPGSDIEVTGSPILVHVR